MTIEIDGVQYITTIYDYGTGDYNITLNFADSIFNGYGTFAIRVNVSLIYYENQTNSANSIANRSVDFPAPMSPESNTEPGGNSTLAFS